MRPEDTKDIKRPGPFAPKAQSTLGSGLSTASPSTTAFVSFASSW